MSERAEARERGERYYLTGRPCPKGHISKRFVTTGTCYECTQTAARRWSKENRASLRPKEAVYRRRNAERISLRERQWRERNRQRLGYPEPTRPCPECCEICGQPPEDSALCLDHCHRTGAFRGWLCKKCNFAIGMFKDNPRLLLSAFNYLASSQRLPIAAFEEDTSPHSDVKAAMRLALIKSDTVKT